jgi:hypothetical protein
VLSVWTAGILAVWFIAGAVLNPGVGEEDIQECVAEGFLPPEECEEALEELEADDPAPISVLIPVLIWFGGSLLLLWVLSRPKAANSS